MQIVKLSVIFLVCISVLLVNGCVSQDDYNDLKLKTDSQSKLIKELESDLQTSKLKLDQMKRRLETIDETIGVEADSLRQKIAALEEDIQTKSTLIASMRQQLLHGGMQLPVELSTMLEDFASESKEMVTYDSNRGIVKFKSDLLFEKGSDIVAPTAAEAVKALCQILNSEQGKKFDIIVAGHTDSVKISKPATLEKHPTNWHLSSHRAISVLNVMLKNGVTTERVSTRGFGEFRPMVPNEPGKVGTPQNRRVEIYIVAKGM